MPLISVYHTFADGGGPAGAMTADRLNTNWTRLYDLVNGDLDQDNIASGYKFARSGVKPSWGAGYEGIFWYDSGDHKVYFGDDTAWVELAAAADYSLSTHDHVGGDGAAIVEAAITLADNTTNDVSTSKHGFVPKATNDAEKYLRDDATWAVPPGYTLPIIGGASSGALSQATYYLGAGAEPYWTTTLSYRKIFVPRTGTIKYAHLRLIQDSGGVTGESISAYIRINDSSDTLIQTSAFSGYFCVHVNSSLSVSVTQGDYISIKIVIPSMSSYPTNVLGQGVIYIQ